MRWQKAGRIGLAVTGLSAAGVIYFYAKDRPQVTPIEQPTPADPAATRELGAGTTTRFEGATRRVRYSYESLKIYTYREALTKAHALF
jgi:hypothetical protein